MLGALRYPRQASASAVLVVSNEWTTGLSGYWRTKADYFADYFKRDWIGDLERDLAQALGPPQGMIHSPAIHRARNHRWESTSVR